MDEFFQKLNRAGIKYLLVGGQAMRFAGMPRHTMDWDLFIPPRDQENIDRLNEILADDLDLPLVPLGTRGENFIQTYQTRWGVIQFHLGVPGAPRFDEAAHQAVTHLTPTGTPVRCLGGEHLLAAKRAAGRPQDQEDIEFLEEMERHGRLR